ncbi:MAG: hypothetical protein ABIH47_05610, partial [Candidatus Omnitrophota bacterium]
KVFILAGSIGMTGAAYLCSQVALRTGSGLVTCGIPKSLGMAEWTIAAVLKTVVLKSTVGSNPTPSAIIKQKRYRKVNEIMLYLKSKES